MKITVLTADYAQADDRGKLHAIGLAWNTVSSPLPPHGVGIVFEVDWHEGETTHLFSLDLVDEDGRPVALGSDGVALVHLESQFEVGRPAGAIRGTPLTQVFAVNFPGGMPLEPGRRYQYRVACGTETGSATFAVAGS